MEPIEVEHFSLHGHDIAVRTAGRGPVVVLLHGMAGSSDTWRFVLPKLAERCTVVAPDLLGHGDSERPRGDYSLGAFANTLRDLLALLGHDRATIVGQSFGGGVAMQFAYQFPERVERIVLVSSGGLGEEVSPILRMLALPGAELLMPLACASPLHRAGLGVASLFGRLGFKANPQLEEIWKAFGSLGDGSTRDAFLHTLRAVVDGGGQRVSAHDRLYLASGIPTLIMWGDRDPIIPSSQAYATHAAMPDSRLEIFPGAGHFPHCEQPEEFVAALVDFLDTTEPARLSEPQWREKLIAAAQQSA